MSITQAVIKRRKKMNIGFRISNEKISRPPREIVEQFRSLPVANIDDNMNRLYCVDAGIRPFNKAPLIGVAFTVKSPGGDNLMMHKAMDLAKPGDIIVVSCVGQADRSVCGEIMMRYAKKIGLAGFVIDGYIRDADGTAELDFPVYARGIQANGPYKNGPGEINVPVAIGGQVVFPGDILVGDIDGIVVVRPEYAEYLISVTKTFNEKEVVTMKNIAEGKGLPRPWVDETLKAKGCQID